VDSGAGLDAVVKRKIPNPLRESNRRSPIVQPLAQRYAAELYWLSFYFEYASLSVFLP
jgi:hypothetical protein